MSRPSRTWTDKLKSLIESRMKELEVVEQFDELEVLSAVVDVGKFIDSRLVPIVLVPELTTEPELTATDRIIDNDKTNRQSRIVMKPEPGQL